MQRSARIIVRGIKPLFRRLRGPVAPTHGTVAVLWCNAVVLCFGACAGIKPLRGRMRKAFVQVRAEASELFF